MKQVFLLFLIIEKLKHLRASFLKIKINNRQFHSNQTIKTDIQFLNIPLPSNEHKTFTKYEDKDNNFYVSSSSHESHNWETD
jgi:hypothetical protein